MARVARRVRPAECMDTDAILNATAHRPWPMPSSPWFMRQTWVDVLFAHWPVDPATLRQNVPEPLEIDTFDGRAWVGVVPFMIRDLGVRSLPGVPTASDFLELNVRTYVRCNGRAGVYFFTLEAASALAVAAARTAFGLPYHHADMSMQRDGDWFVYASERDDGTASFRARYRAAESQAQAAPQPGSLEHFLVERYALMNVAAGAVTNVQIHHRPWPLQPALADIELNTIIGTAGVSTGGTEPLCHFVREQPTVNWLLADGCPNE
jgi:uncharacterized protein YqjF (DUF2071 family)